MRLTCVLLIALAVAACGSEPRSKAAPFDSLAARSELGMVSAATPEATEAGLAVLRTGGNAVDAAVAVGFALAVTYPQAGNLGGGGFMVIRLADGRATTIDFREKAPAAATRTMFLDSAGTFVPKRSQIGALAVGVPGSPAGLLTALEKYGTKPRADVLRPAIALADDGFTIPPGLAKELHEKLADFSSFPSTMNVVATGMGGTGDSVRTTLPAGTLWKQPALAATLRRISKNGGDGFYKGPTAALIVEQMRRSGGIITGEDLAAYRPAERAPIRATYRGDTIISMPPPSSGGVMLAEMFNMMERYNFDTIGWHSARHAQVLAEIMRRAYADRAEHLGDPDFYRVPIRGLVSKQYAADRAASITGRATASDSVSHGDAERYNHESPQTTHYSVVDRWGNCVSVTVTLNSSFGCKLIVEGGGFFLNNEMDDFAAKPAVANLYGLVGAEANAIVPGKRMLSSMTPTIVVGKGGPFLVVGTPGGSTIISTVLQVIHNQLDYGMSLSDAVAAPRLHHQWRPDTLFYEQGTFTPGALDTLARLGYTTVARTEPSGRVDAIRIEPGADGKPVHLGVSDTRGYGRARGENE